MTKRRKTEFTGKAASKARKQLGAMYEEMASASLATRDWADVPKAKALRLLGRYIERIGKRKSAVEFDRQRIDSSIRTATIMKAPVARIVDLAEAYELLGWALKGYERRLKRARVLRGQIRRRSK